MRRPSSALVLPLTALVLPLTALALPLTALALLLAAAPAAAEAAGAARLGKRDQSSEYWDLTVSFASGHRLFERFSISNEGPGDRTAYAIGQVVFPDGRVASFENGRLEGNWELSEDRLRMEVGSSVLDLHGASHHFEVDKNKKGVKIFLDFAPGADLPRRWTAAPDGWNVELLALGAEIRGSLWIRDQMGEQTAPLSVSGRVTLSHSWMDESEYRLTRRRIDLYRLAPGAQDAARAWGLQLLPEKGDARCWMLARRPDGTLVESDHLCWTGSGASPAGSDRYPIPASLEASGPDLEGRVELGRRQLEHDPLSLAPRPFRWLLSFRADPLQVWLDAKLALRWTGAGEAFSLAGDGLVSYYFTNPLPER